MIINHNIFIDFNNKCDIMNISLMQNGKNDLIS